MQFDIFATDSDFCIYPEGICETCSGENDGTGTVVNNDSDGDGVCDEDEVPGCQEETACNYNSNATDSDNSCVFPEGIVNHVPVKLMDPEPSSTMTPMEMESVTT